MTDSTNITNDTIYYSHSIRDTIEHDTLIVAHDTDTSYYFTEIIHEKELEIIQDLISRKDFGKSTASIIILFFVIWAVLRRYKKNG